MNEPRLYHPPWGKGGRHTDGHKGACISVAKGNYLFLHSPSFVSPLLKNVLVIIWLKKKLWGVRGKRDTCLRLHLCAHPCQAAPIHKYCPRISGVRNVSPFKNSPPTRTQLIVCNIRAFCSTCAFNLLFEAKTHISWNCNSWGTASKCRLELTWNKYILI